MLSSICKLSLLCCDRLLTQSSDAEETRYVYEWRLEQEAMLRSTTGTGMTDEEVLRFVDGCE